MSPQRMAAAVWRRVEAQHGVITWWQLREIGYTRDAIAHRLATARLFRLWPGVYAVGRPQLDSLGRWKAATLACGGGYALDGESGLALLGIRGNEGREIEVAGPAEAGVGLDGIRSRRLARVSDHLDVVEGIPVLSLPLLFVRIAPRLSRGRLEAAINEADKRDLIHVEELRRELEQHRRRRGVARLRRTIDIATFRYTDSELERAMRPVFRRAGLGYDYLTQEWVNGHRVDFYFPALDFVVETDGGRFHRTAFQQRQDRRRDQAHTLAGTAFLRFTHGQVRFERAYVEDSVAKVARRLLGSTPDLYVP